MAKAISTKELIKAGKAKKERQEEIASTFLAKTARHRLHQSY